VEISPSVIDKDQHFGDEERGTTRDEDALQHEEEIQKKMLGERKRMGWQKRVRKLNLGQKTPSKHKKRQSNTRSTRGDLDFGEKERKGGGGKRKGKSSTE